MRRLYLAGFMMAIALIGGFSSAARAEPKQAFVFFSEWSAFIDQDAIAAIQHAANLAKASSSHKVTVRGYADTTGSETANKYLSQLRSQVVTDQLIEDGVPAASITQDAMGETPSPPDSTQESRRVSITVGE
jgi:outer membrane protein OmpA-like peptidoglycan-associated protein